MVRINPDTKLVPEGDIKRRIEMNNQYLAPSDIPGHPDIYRVSGHGISFLIKKSRFYPYGSVRNFKDEEDIRQLYFYPYIKNAVFYDVGAATGTWTLRALAMGAKKVIAFEPDPRNVEALSDNVDLNGFRDRFVCHDMALYDQNVFLDFDELEDVPAVQLDEFVIPEEDKPDIIKIDVEGMEYNVLKGARKTIEKYKPRIIVENHPLKVAEVTGMVTDELTSQYNVETRSFSHFYTK